MTRAIDLARAGMDANTLVKQLGGTVAAALFFGVKPPSVSEWLGRGAIPDARLMQKAAELEVITGGAFSRILNWPDQWQKIWPEFEKSNAKYAQPATETVAGATP